MALISLQDVFIAFGGPPVLECVNLQIQKGEKVCLLGRNGAGKTTLLKLINNDLEPDKGTMARQQGITTAYLPQEVPQTLSGQVFHIVLGGFEKHTLETEGEWEIHRQTNTLITRMNLDANATFESLSAGMKRRVLLAKALVSKPDILLLDEPTNHLDIDAITWLEDFLSRYEGTLLFVTHDRMLVKKIANRIIELDRGKLSNWDCDYQTYLERKEATLDAEKGQWALFDKNLDKEEEWLKRGVKDRRVRDEGRVNALLRMREERRARRELMGTAKINLQEAKRSGKLVVEAENVCFGFNEKPIIRDFSTLIMRGDRVGIIGPNGSGKTTILQVLLGRLEPQQGSIRLGVKLEVTYFDQLRDQLEEEKSVQDNVASGNDRVLINGKNRHIIGYLQDFLFSPERARTPVKVLSGGERNRLLLAKLFARPSNLLVMDEPTNDLDMETLELLEDLLIEYKGTLLLVSHDRAFLNNVVTSTLVLEGEGRVEEYIGGYDDWLRQRPLPTSPAAPAAPSTPKSPTQEPGEKPQQRRQRPRKLTNKEKLELETLPQRIEELETEQHELYQIMSDPEFYKQDGRAAARTAERLQTLKDDLSRAYHRWEELENIEKI
ncbi:MAG: transport system ATP-binding/permease protein [Acidobacteriota bacterium]|nr:transport system ATP-binding/permease protein [Acidobacteriota bacterium]